MRERRDLYLQALGSETGRALLWVPHRRPPFANATLVHFATLSRDMGVNLAMVLGREIEGVEALDARIMDGIDRWHAPESDSDA